MSARRACLFGIAAALPLSLAGCAHYAPEAVLLAAPSQPEPSPSPAWTVHAPGDSAEIPGFPEVVDRILAAHPALEAARHRVLAAEGARMQAGAWTNPSVSAEIEGWGLDREGLDDAEVTLSAGFPLDLVGKRSVRAARAEAERDAERARYQETRRSLIAQAREAVHAVRAGRERVRLAVERQGVTEETAATVGREVEAGKAAPLEQVRAEVDRENARADLFAERSALREARLGLAALGGMPGGEAEVAGGLRQSPAVLDSVRLSAELDEHPVLLAASWDAQAAAERGRQAARERWPDLEALVGVRHYVAESRSAWVTGLALDLPLWDHKSGAVREARELASAASLEEETVRRDLRRELERLLLHVEESGGRLALLGDRVLPQARDALEIARAGFEGGKFGYLELLDAQRSLLEAESRRVEALIAYDEALGRLESLLGREPDHGIVPEAP